MIPPVTEPELKEFFGKAAEGVVSVKFILDKETGAQRHFAYVGVSVVCLFKKESKTDSHWFSLTLVR